MVTLLVVFALAIYLLPTILAAILGMHRLGAILLVNVFLGWTIAGWVIAALWVYEQIEERRDRRVDYTPRREVRNH